MTQKREAWDQLRPIPTLTGVAQWVGLQSCKPKGHQFDSQSGQSIVEPGLWARFLVGGVREATDRCFSRTSMFLSFAFSLPSPSLKINKVLKNKDQFPNIRQYSEETFICNPPFFPACVAIVTFQRIYESQSGLNYQVQSVSLFGTYFFRKTFLYVGFHRKLRFSFLQHGVS